MEYIFLSFVAGFLTVLAPCVLPILPIIVGGTAANLEEKNRRYLLITLGLVSSIGLFSILLRATTLFIQIETAVWQLISGLIILIFGIFTLFPSLWTSIETKLGLGELSGNLLTKSGSVKRKNLGSFVLGAALGPVFTTCSPTYALIVAVLLPQDIFTGTINLIAYLVGVFIVFSLIAYGSQKLLARLKNLSAPNSKFKKVLGIIFILLGLAIIFGIDKQIEIFLLDNGFGNLLIDIEKGLFNSVN